MTEISGDIFTLHPPRQTLKAWEPLWDCVSVLMQFQNSDVADGDNELREWRLFWVAGVSLLRTIGHVLAKVDAKSSSNHEILICKMWNRIKTEEIEPHIFLDFIDNERNELLKTYTFGARLMYDGGDIRVIYKGEVDAFQLFREAVYWWRRQLMDLESDLLDLMGSVIKCGD